MVSISTDQRCPKCQGYCAGSCFEDVNAVHVEGEGWHYVGSKADEDRPDTLPAQCPGCGGTIGLDGQTYRCYGHDDEEDAITGETFAGAEPCGTSFPIRRHVAYDVIF